MFLQLSALRVGFFMISVLIGTFLKFWADLHTSDTISAFISRCGISGKFFRILRVAPLFRRRMA